MYYSFQTDGDTDNSVALAISSGNIIDPITKAVITDPVDAIRVILSLAFNPVILQNPNTTSAARKVTADTADTNYVASLYPNPVVSAQFEIQPHALTIHNGNSATFTTDLIFLDPAYSGTVSFSCALVGGSYAGVSFGTYSPTTLSAPGSTGILITVAGGTPPAVLQITVTATDGTYTNKVTVGFAVT